MVGDRLYTDIRMAHDAGTASIMVLTGEASADDVVEGGTEPTYILDSVADIPELVMRERP